ncbi:PAS domain S-box protein [Chloroflexota bacterium]
MEDKVKNKDQLLHELELLRARVTELEQVGEERDQAEVTLQKSEERYRTVVNDQTEMISRFTPDNIIVFVNDASCHFFGETFDQIVGTNVYDRIPEGDHARVQEALAGLSVDNPVISVENRDIASDGSIRWFSWTDRAFFDEEGTIVEIQSVGRDITERKRFEEELHASEQFAHSVLNGLLAHIAILDETGTILAVNQAWRDFATANSLVPQNSFEGTNYLSVCENAIGLHAEEATLFAQGIRAVLAGDQQVFELQYPCHSLDEERWFMGRVTRFPGEGSPKVVVAHENITSEKQAEHALRESEAMLRSIFRAAPTGIGLVSERVLLQINERICEMTGYTHAELINQSARILYPTDEEFETVGQEKYAQIQSHDTGTVETRWQCKDGRIIDVLLSSTPLNPADLSVGVTLTALDITERKQVEEALRENEERLKILFEFAPDAYYMIDLEGKFIDGNKAAEQLIGYERSELIGQSFLKLNLLSVKQFPKAAALLARNLLEKATGPNEFTLNRKDSSQVSVEIRTFQVQIKGQTVVLGIARDITERKQAEEKLHESEMLLRNAVEGAPIILFKLDTKGVFQLSTGAGLKGLGLKPGEVVGLSHFELYRDLPEANEYVRRALKGEAVSFMYEARDIVWDVRYSPLFGPQDEIIGMVGVAHDITERKQAQEALRESEEKFRNIIEASPLGMHMYQLEPDNRLVFIDANPAADEILGVDNSQFVGHTIEEAFPPLSETEVPERYRLAAAQGIRWQTEQIVYEDAQITGAFDVRAFQTSPGKMVALFHDITARKRIEKELENHRNHLEAMVRERTVALEEANEGLRVLSRVKDEFVSNVSHELRTPIANLKLRHYLLAKVPDRLEDHLAVIQRETERLEHIIESLLYLSRLDQDRVDWNPVLVDLNLLTSQLVNDRIAFAQSRELSLAFTSEPNLPLVKADVALWEQALSILLTNSFNYTPASGYVEVKTHEREWNRKRWVGVSVSDTGLGIPTDEQPHLFERFFRGVAGRESGTPGTGLGLAIVQEIVNKHQGQAEFYSEGVPGKGTTFSLWLPVAE